MAYVLSSRSLFAPGFEWGHCVEIAGANHWPMLDDLARVLRGARGRSGMRLRGPSPVTTLHRVGGPRDQQGGGKAALEMTAWKNWSGSVSAAPRHFETASNEAGLRELIAATASQHTGIRVVGSGHSFAPLCATDDLLIHVGGLAGELIPVPGKREFAVWAGARLSELGALLLQRGMALENQGDVDYQTAAGAIATGTHGTGSRFGSLSTQVTALRLILASGDVLQCSQAVEPEVFKAACVSMGLLGVISQVTVRVVPAFRLLERNRAVEVDEVLAEFESLDAANRHVEFFWVPGVDKCALKILSATEDEVSGAAPALLAPPGTIERYLLPDRVDWSCRLFPSERTVPFNEMEFAVPATSGPDCFLEIRNLVLFKHRTARWSVEYRTQQADGLHLSPAYGRDVVAISVHEAAGHTYQSFFNDVEAIFHNHRGRPHWAKLHSHTARDLRELYPKWDQFHAIRERLDPRGRFLNAYLRRLVVE